MKRLILTISFLFIMNLLIIYKINQGIDLAASIISILIIYFIITVFTFRIYKQDKNFIGIVFYIIAAVILGQGMIFFTYTKSISSEENRQLAKFPDVNPFHEDFAEQMDKYINDRIGLREYALKIYSRINLFDGINLKSIVITGQNGWLFLNNENDIFTYFQRVKTYTPEKLNTIKELVEDNIKFCQDNGIDFVLVIPPNKSTVYPEYYNKYINKKTGKDNYLVLKEYITQNFPNAHILMPYDELINLKNQTGYYSTDTHWNSIGAFTAYKSLEKVIRQVNPEYSLFDNNIIKECEQDVLYDLEYLSNNVRSAGKKYKGICIDGIENIKLVQNNKSAEWHKAYGGEKAPRILLIHDSFMQELAPFISTGASYLGQIWTYEPEFSKISDLILEYKPDIIIWERIERYWF